MHEWIISLTNAIAPAWWGAVLSTMLAIIKVWELWRDRFKIEVGSSFATAAHIGNEVRIRNLSPKPQILTHWEIFYRSGIPLLRTEKSICCRDFDTDDSCIAPSSTQKLTFSGESYFSTTAEKLKGRSIYIRVYVAGRRPVCHKIYPFE